MASYDDRTQSFAKGGRIWINADEFIVGFMKYTKAIDPMSGKAEGSRMVTTSMRKAGNYIKKISKANLQSRNNVVTGNLKSAYRVKVKRFKGGTAGVLVGFDHRGHHAHLVDSGHEVVDNRNGEKLHTGKKAKGSYFHTNAREHLPQAAAVFVAAYERELIEHAQYWDAQGKHSIAQKFMR